MTVLVPLPLLPHITSATSVTTVNAVLTVATAIRATTVITNTTIQDDMIRAMAMEQKLKMQQKGNRAMGVL